MKSSRCAFFFPITAATAICVLMFPASAVAQAASCKADIATFCGQTEKGSARISQCIKQSLEQLSPNCRAHIKAVEVQLKETRQPCADELLLYCEGLDLAEGRLQQCLRRNRAQLSAECQRLADLMQPR